MQNKHAQNLRIHKISIYFSLRNKFFKWIEAALFHVVGQVDIFSMSLHLGVNGGQKMTGTCFIIQRLETPWVAN